MTAPRQPRRACALLLCLLLVPLTAGAQPAATSFGELISVLPSQAELTVVDTQGRQTRGRLLELSPASLTLLTQEGRTTVAAGDVQSIRHRRKDPVSNGALWGALVGAGFGATMLAVSSSQPGYDGEMGGPLLIPGLSAGIGLATGLAIDAATSRTDLVFSRAGRSAQLSLAPTRVGRGIAVMSHLRLPDVSGIAPERPFLQAQGRATGNATRSRRGRMGALIGLAAGTAAATLYWANSNCRYGSDSAAAIVTHCVVPSGAMIAGGWYVGRMVGRGQSQNTP